MSLKKWFTGLATVGALFLTACGGSENTDNTASESTDSGESSEPIELSVGVVGENERTVWEDVAERLTDQNITLEIVQFSDYNQPNEGVAAGDLDLNAFQHVAFLNDYNESTGNDLKPVGYTYISPMGIYSEEVESVEDIQDGATITIPNDVTNGGRALFFLDQLGLITLADVGNESPTTDDIETYNVDITIEPVDAAQTARTLADATASIINTNFAVDAGLNPEEDALQLDTDEIEEVREYYKNVIAVSPENAEAPWVETIVNEYQTDATAELIGETSANADVAAWSDDDDFSDNGTNEGSSEESLEE